MTIKVGIVGATGLSTLQGVRSLSDTDITALCKSGSYTDQIINL